MKTFLTTTALVAGLALASNAKAEGIDITIGGFADFQVGIIDTDFQGSTNDVYFRNDTEIHLGLIGESDSLTYGAVIELEADVSSETDNQGVNADKTYIFVESDFGRVELGNVDGAENRLKINGSVIARGTGGTDGDFGHFVTTNTDDFNNETGVFGADGQLDTLANGFYGGLFFTTPNLLAQAIEGNTEDSSKLSYYTPRFGGVQLGVSYAPNSGSAGQSIFGTNIYEDIISAGINYALDIDGIGVEASVTGEFADAVATGVDDLETYAIGLGVNFEGFQIAGSYGDLGNTDALNDFIDNGIADGSFITDTSTEYYDVTVAFDAGEFGVSVGYFNSEFEVSGVAGTLEFENISVGVDYEIAPGFTGYIEGNFFEFDDAGVTSDGNVIILGTQLTF